MQRVWPGLLVSLWLGTGCAPAVGPLFTTADAGSAIVRPSMRLQYQLEGALDPGVAADLFVVDLFDTTRSVVAQLHALDHVAVAYIAAGSYEPWRTDVATLPASVIGAPLAGYPKEAWLDVRASSVRQLMAARLTLAADKGFDGVLLVSLDGYLTESGHDLTAQDQLDYNLWLANQAAERGLARGISSDWAHAEMLAHNYDFAIHLNCLADGNCAELAPYRDVGHPVFDLETSRDPTATCARAAGLALPVTLKNDNFDAWLATCP